MIETMSMDQIYSYTDYKKYLNDIVEQNQHVRSYKSQLADAAGCQRSFMSQVLNSHIHLTPDHAVGLAAFWKLGADTTEFFLEMVHYGRAVTPALRMHLLKRLKQMVNRQRDAMAEVESPVLTEIEHQSIYYSNWHWSALHILSQVKGSGDEKSLSERLHLPLNTVQHALTVLQTMGLVVRKKESWVATQTNVHAPVNSIHSWLHHASWRQRANEIMRRESEGAIHFTGVYSLSRADMERIGDLVLELVEAANKIVGPSHEEDVACLCLDWFSV